MIIKPFNKKLAQLTQILSDGNYHSGSELGAKLQITRSAIWKMIKKLQGYGVSLHSTQSNGYLLAEPLLLLDPKTIKQGLSLEAAVTVLESITSTNDYFRLTKSFSNKKIHFCFSEEQTKGRGRRQRVWHSPFGKNIYLSCRYPIQKDLSELAGLSLIVGLAIKAMLASLNLPEASVKWPNDLMLGEKKIAGVLIDVQAESHSISIATIGIGLNVNVTAINRASIDQSWTSLRDQQKTFLDRNKIAILLAKSLLTYMKRFERTGFSAFSKEWSAADFLAGKKLTFQHHDDSITGTALGINDQGHLLLKLASGRVQAYSSGDAYLVRTR